MPSVFPDPARHLAVLRDVSMPSVYPDPVRHPLLMLRDVSMPSGLPRSCSTSIMLRDVSMPSVYPDTVRHLLCCEMFQCQAFTPILCDIYCVARCFNAKRLPRSCSTSIILRDVSMPSVYPDPVRHLLCCEMRQCQACTPILFDIYYVARCFNAKRFTPILFDIYYVATCFLMPRV